MRVVHRSATEIRSSDLAPSNERPESEREKLEPGIQVQIYGIYAQGQTADLIV